MSDSSSSDYLKTEIVAGITTFLASMYIIIVNPQILQKSGMPYSAVLTATVLISAFSSILMGFYAKNPILVAPGMGLNAFFTYSLVIGMKVSWQTALGAVFWSGIIFLLLSIFNIRRLIIQAIPLQIRYGIATGIGLFITLIGFINAGFIISNPSTILSRSQMNPEIITFLVGLLITAFLVFKGIRGALILGIIITSILSIFLGRIYGSRVLISAPESGILSLPDFFLFGKLDILDSIRL